MKVCVQSTPVCASGAVLVCKWHGAVMLMVVLVPPKVRNGSDAQSPLLGRFCGRAVPSPIFPSSHVLYLRFRSDFAGARDGYEITWTSSPSGKAADAK